MEEKLPNKSETNQAKSGNRTLLLILGLGVLTVTLIAVAILPKKQTTPSNKTTATVRQQAAKTTLTLSPQAKKTTDGFYNVDVNIETGTNKVTGTQLELSYDPKALTGVDIVAGQFLPSSNVLIEKVDQPNGRITYALGVGLGQPGVSGKGTVATIRFKVVPGQSFPISTKIDFLPKTEVSSEDSLESVLQTAVGSTFTLDSAPTSTTSGQ